MISVVTPFYNTAPLLARCIESVLSQSYPDFEYILMDNCSTDGSADIAQAYAERDTRIRFIRCSEFVPQLPNYNRALGEISNESQYCKVVQADDYIFPDCLKLMVQTFEVSESIGLVSSYRLDGSIVNGSGYPYPAGMIPGRECGRWYLRTGIQIFGSQTTVMYRSSLVRNHNPFYDVSVPYADLKKCMEILERWDFGFVNQVLSFSSPLIGSVPSVSSARLQFRPFESDRYVIVQQYASQFLERSEATSVRKESKRVYYWILAEEALHLRKSGFWQYQRARLKVVNEKVDWPYLALKMTSALLWLVCNPGLTTVRLLDFFKRKMKMKCGSEDAGQV